ncbi:threonine-phosphate decarboxylase CobD [Pinisolibacter aquiterrae]|uniref:threonine-phosphate decarboxylase CobD n=1 Tax=Pinisolibacter aquiterrae TaxID=2815579 RepID=UPI001E36D92B|nr:threonine-phosphate decarboxylase CobD [Pinisolibacter aquiterrae]MCC8234182.1 threonine-phosphate decarboxylase CobD [Pinisolibacter aquiterrae]
MSDPQVSEMGTGPRGETPAGAASPVYHGGNLAQARAAHPGAPTPWIDLSTGIDPVAWPVPALPPEAWTRLPEPADVAALEAVAATAFGLHDPADLAAVPGTQAAIQMLPRLLSGATVGILGFTYQEHAHVWRAAGRTVTVVERLEDLARFDVGLLVNPNNPDGRLVPPERLAALALDMGATGRRLVVDEAFVDILPDGASLAPRLPLAGAVVLRSFGKTWGLAGLRLGFVAADAAFAAAMRNAFGPWALSGPALAIGRAALADRLWLEAARARTAVDAARLDALLMRAGLTVIGGTPLFRLARSEDAARLAEGLARAGIHLRRFPHDPRLLRFGLPGDVAEWRRLAEALEDLARRDAGIAG